MHTAKFGTESEHLAYLAIFLNAVSLRLQLLRPPISLCLKSLDIVYQPESYAVLWRTGGLLGHETLPKLRAYVQQNSIANAADVVYFLTGRDMVKRYKEGVSSTISGVAYGEGVCTGNKVALGEDQPGTFLGVRTAAHEIAHLLGAIHDGEGTATKCLKEDGYIMTSMPRTKEVFSPCTIEQVASLLNTPKVDCLRHSTFTRAVSVPELSVKLPGEVLDGSRFCKYYFSNYRNATYVKVCRNTVCA